MKVIFLCTMPFINLAGRLGTEVEALIENPDSCQKECRLLEQKIPLQKVFGAAPMARITVENGKIFIAKRKKGTMLPREATKQSMNDAYCSFMDGNPEKATHKNSFETGLWEEPKEIKPLDLIPFLQRNYNVSGAYFICEKTVLELEKDTKKFETLMSIENAKAAKRKKKPCSNCEKNKKLGHKFCFCGRQVNESYLGASKLYCPACNIASMYKQTTVNKGCHCPNCGKPTGIIISSGEFMSCAR